MSTTTRFGQHLLLKKLAEDPLGETYRAGRLEGTTIGDVVLLRVFGHPGLDTARLTQAFAEGAQQHAASSGLGVSWALELGEVGGLPYAAYEYLPGRDLASLQKALEGGFEPLSEDHAVLLLERVAKGQALLHAANPGMPAHGFVTPHLIWVSNEGEAKLFGFEAGPQLAAMAAAGQLAPELMIYLSPEVLHGATPTDRDDVYSLGAILWQLLFGTPPSTAAGPFDIQLHQATLSASGGQVPPGLARLLQRSLAPAAERIQTIDQWHRELIGWMAEAPVSATTFDLAFFLHELFRDEIRREAREIEKEKSLDLRPSPAPAPLATPETVLDPTRQTTPIDARSLETERALASGEMAAETAPARSKTGLIAAIAVLVAIGVGVGVFLSRPAPEPEPAPVAQVAAPAPQQPAVDIEATAAALDQLMHERQQQMEERLRQEYDSQIAALQQQLTDAQTSPAQPGSAPAAAPTTGSVAGTQATSGPAAPASTTAAPATAAPPPATAASPPAASNPTAPAPSQTASEPPAARVAANEPAPPPAPVTPPPAEPAASEPTRTAAATPPPTTPPPAASTTAPAVNAPKIQPPALIRRPDPVYPARARAVKRSAIVAVKVLVGRDGRVVEAQPVSPQPKDLGFEDAALKAALKAEYQPATRDGETIEMWTTLVFNFKL